jgi:hypothetical protein
MATGYLILVVIAAAAVVAFAFVVARLWRGSGGVVILATSPGDSHLGDNSSRRSQPPLAGGTTGTG